MLSKNLNKLRRKPGTVTVAVLSLLLGVQVAVFADIQYDYDYGFNAGQHAEQHFGWGADGDASFFVSSMCQAHFSDPVDINECEYAGKLGYNSLAHPGQNVN